MDKGSKNHSLDDIEFYPEASDLIKRLRGMNLEEKKSALGIGIELDGWEPKEFVKTLKRRNPGKWRKLVNLVLSS
jgi:hypothetical protein